MYTSTLRAASISQSVYSELGGPQLYNSDSEKENLLFGQAKENIKKFNFDFLGILNRAAHR